VNVRMTLDVPVHHLPALERTLSRQGLAITPYLKNGVQRWKLDVRVSPATPSIPETIVASGVEEAA
jgi:hypothetical protein